MQTQKKSFFSEWRSDLPAGVIVFLVAVPLCLGIALASGAPLFAGLIAGMVGGTIVALTSDSALGVSGPAAGLAVIVLTAIQDLGSFEIFLMAVVIGGIFQLILGFLRAGVIGYYFPSSVIKGMLSGIGLIIFLKQIPHAFGYDKDYEGDLAYVSPEGETTFAALGNMLDAISPGAVLISFVCLAILILWEQKFMKKIKLFQLVQGPLVAVVAGILLNLGLVGTAWALKADQLVSIPVAESFNGFINQFTLPDFSQITNPQVYIVGITIAVVASLETLLCVEATDKLDPQKRVTPTNRELKAQGLGNMISGLIGGLPVTQVIVRSSANIQSGGKTKAAAFFHGLMLLFCVALIPVLLNMIPLASLAAILLLVGYKLAKPSLFRSMYKLGWQQFMPFIATIIGILLTDLLIGIGIGLVVAVFYILLINYRAPYFYHIEKDPEDAGAIRLVLSEDVTFLNKASILRTLNEIPNDNKVIIDATHSVNIDYDVIEIIEEFKTNAETRNITVSVLGINEETMTLESSKSQRVKNKSVVSPEYTEVLN
ncbi:MAG: SulP family inorganic anion transporter [Bacteroidota bacterium]